MYHYLRYLWILFFLVIIIPCFSQKNDSTIFKIRIEAGPQFSFPLNPYFKNTQSFGMGATARAAYYFNNTFSAGIRVNYDYFIGKKYKINGTTDNYFNLTWTSAMGNVQFDVTDHFFAGGDVGLGLLSINGNVNAAFNSSLYTGYNIHTNKNDFGIVIAWSQAKKPTTNFSSMGLRVQYNFN